MNSDKKLAFVTGASRGIGKAIAVKLLQSDLDVAIGYKTNRDLANEVAKSYNGLAIQVDITNRKSIKNAIEKCKKYFKKDINILINNAGIAQEKPFETITDDDWDKMLITNLRGAFSFSQEVIPDMVEQSWGRIVNITSIGGQWGGYNQVHYAAAKAGLISLTMSLAKIYSKYGITTNAVAPGLVSTDMSKYELNTKEGKKKAASIPIGRIATAKEIANVVAFLASDEASYITGQTINVNGGMYFG